MTEVFARTCPGVSGCLALDDALASRPRDEVFPEDGHWAAHGHRIAAREIAAYLQTLPGFGAAADNRTPLLRRSSATTALQRRALPEAAHRLTKLARARRPITQTKLAGECPATIARRVRTRRMALLQSGDSSVAGERDALC